MFNQQYMGNPMTMNPSFQNSQSFQNPYLERLNSLQPQQAQRYEITKVNGRNGAGAFPMPANSEILLLDETQPIVWLKQTDGAGYPTITPYQITPYQTQLEPDFNSLDERIKRLEEVINGKSNNVNAASADEA